VIRIEKNISFGPLNAFRMNISYNNPHDFNIENEPTSHIHEGFEIYFNLSGDVSFIVENCTFPINRGNIIFTKPYEYHHCIFNDNKEHEHYCLQFFVDENDEMFSPLLNREKGKNNCITLTEDKTKTILRHFEALMDSDTLSPLEKHYHFISILHIIHSNINDITQTNTDSIPQTLTKALNIISKRYNEPITVHSIANDIFVSVNTLERQFKKHLNITPREYIKRKRLAEAMVLLNSNISITQVASKCGFPDTSNFIQLFKRTFGVTPYKYIRNQNNR